MLTDYMVTCPRPGCHWSGSLLPAGSLDVWRPALPSTNIIVFCCPRCQGEWHARIVGDDAVPIHEEELSASQA